MKKLFYLLALPIIFICACGNDDDAGDPAPQPTRTELLTNKQWKITAITIEPEYMGMTDLYTNMYPCIKDDLVKFQTDSVVIYDEGALKCDTADPQTTEGVWYFMDNETKIIETDPGSGLSSISNISSLSENELVVKNDYEENGQEYTITTTYQKQ